VCEHGLYWIAVSSEDEGRYLLAVLNSETVRALAAPRQARGQWGARHFDKVLLDLPIPRFDSREALHRALAAAGKRAEEVAALVPLREGEHFVGARRRIRAALREDGVAEWTEGLVRELLGSTRG
jgi:CheY-like chemotaxis protein